MKPICLRVAAVLPLLLSALPVMAQGSADLLRCRALSDATARLACYDAIPLPAPGTPAASSAAGASAAAPSSSRATPAAPQAQLPEQFGLERQQSQMLVKSIDSRLIGAFEGWEPNQRFTLENGQVWQVSDDSRGVGYRTNPKVRITRGTFGTFFMEIEGVNAAPRVKRLR